jgi:hypothetical protein
VIVAPRPTAATSGAVPTTPLDTFAGFNNLALLGKANNTNIATMQGASVTEDRKIHWDADVIVHSSAAPNWSSMRLATSPVRRWCPPNAAELLPAAWGEFGSVGAGE